METYTALVSIPAALAVIVTVRLILNYAASESQKVRDVRAIELTALSTERTQNLTIWSNHLSKTVESQVEVARALQRVADTLQVLMDRTK